jgi:hypothetical protein
MADSREYDVIIIGGGATGAGIARDCALRGLKAALVERYDIATGATGRNHGLLHSGARYAVTDSESARECISENRILRRIARHCIEPTSGLFITLPEDDPAYQHTFITACQQAGIEAQPLTPAEALRIEPAVNPALLGAVQVPTAPSILSASPPQICSMPANMAPLSSPAAKSPACCVRAIASMASRSTTISSVNRARCARRWWSTPPGSGGSASQSMPTCASRCFRQKDRC